MTEEEWAQWKQIIVDIVNLQVKDVQNLARLTGSVERIVTTLQLQQETIKLLEERTHVDRKKRRWF